MLVWFEGSAQSEDRNQRLVDTPQLFGAEVARETPQPTRVDSTKLFDEHPRCLAVHVDLGSE